MWAGRAEGGGAYRRVSLVSALQLGSSGPVSWLSRRDIIKEGGGGGALRESGSAAGGHQQQQADCEAVLQREPHHFGALSGMGLCLYKMGDLPAALDAFDSTVRVHPGLTEIRKLAEQIRAKLAG
eukprot:jgi/Tetstr1/433038/TSEL_022375.t1